MSGRSPMGTSKLSNVHLTNLAIGPTISCIILIFEIKSKD